MSGSLANESLTRAELLEILSREVAARQKAEEKLLRSEKALEAQDFCIQHNHEEWLKMREERDSARAAALEEAAMAAEAHAFRAIDSRLGIAADIRALINRV